MSADNNTLTSTACATPASRLTALKRVVWAVSSSMLPATEMLRLLRE